MIVPQYWAESTAKDRSQGKQVSVRRFGWSDVSQSDARQMADQRATEALARVLSGERLDRREPKVAYNGAEGVPIREEIISRHGETIITRNAYGARCLNTPNVLFADVDHERPATGCTFLAIFVLVVAVDVLVGIYLRSFLVGLALVVLTILAIRWIEAIRMRGITEQQQQQLREAAARERIADFVRWNPLWQVRLYRSPAGLRVLVMHDTFSPGDPLVQRFFAAIEADPVYVQMCTRQQCFRARVSPKPWRIGIPDHIRPRPGVWPVAEARRPDRDKWIERYEAAAVGYSACQFIETIGTGSIHPTAREVQELHDQLCGATSGRPIA